MMTGSVTAGLQALLELEVLGPNGRSEDVETVIDTGFDGELILPRTLVASLALNQRGKYLARLADGTRVVLDYYDAIVIWHGQPRKVNVLPSAPSPCWAWSCCKEAGSSSMPAPPAL